MSSKKKKTVQNLCDLRNEINKLLSSATVLSTFYKERDTFFLAGSSSGNALTSSLQIAISSKKSKNWNGHHILINEDGDVITNHLVEEEKLPKFPCFVIVESITLEEGDEWERENEEDED